LQSRLQSVARNDRYGQAGAGKFAAGVPIQAPFRGYRARHRLTTRSAAMKTRPALTAADARAIAAAAEAEANPTAGAFSIAVDDDGGHVLWLQRLDGAAPISAEIAPAKARTAAVGRRESKVYEDMINQGRVSFLSAPLLHGMLEGGVPIVVDGECVGAVGVSGVKSSEDAQIARAGIAAVVG
jgi:glc operon protein GlcG